MPKNKWIYYGILVVAATALLWLGTQILNMVKYILPATATVGVILVIVGLYLESRRSEEEAEDRDDSP